MNDESDLDRPVERSSLALAGEWGMTLAVATLLGALGGYFIGEQLHNKGLTIVLILGGIGGCFTLGVMRMLKVTEQYANSGGSKDKSAPGADGNEGEKRSRSGAIGVRPLSRAEAGGEDSCGSSPASDWTSLADLEHGGGKRRPQHAGDTSAVNRPAGADGGAQAAPDRADSPGTAQSATSAESGGRQAGSADGAEPWYEEFLKDD